jgi:hypothetical protein
MAGCNGDGTPAAPSPGRPVVNEVRHTLSGRIRDPNGHPIPAAALGVMIGLRFTGIGVVSDAHGQYSMSVPEGSLHLSVGHPSFRDIGQFVTIRMDTSLDVTLVPGVNLVGRVAAPGAQNPWDEPVVEIVSGPDAGRTNLTRPINADSFSYFFHELAPGPLTVRARKHGFEPAEQRVDITADATLDFTLKKAN